ncbi:hypothetical protein C4J96_2335 [Pseudomonas orientalis]|nr:hypothetical protein C4J96_2335 [Pseudomonas orientalis]
MNLIDNPCGRGLAPDDGGSVRVFATDTPQSGASPLPHFYRAWLD